MTLIQRLRGLLTTDQPIAPLQITYMDAHCAALEEHQITFQSTIAEQMCEQWEGATIRDQIFRETADRVSVHIIPAAVSCLWRFEDGSGLAASDAGVWVL